MAKATWQSEVTGAILMDIFDGRCNSRNSAKLHIKFFYFQNFLDDIFLVEMSDLFNFADDNTLYVYGGNLPSVLSNLGTFYEE